MVTLLDLGSDALQTNAPRQMLTVKCSAKNVPRNKMLPHKMLSPKKCSLKKNALQSNPLINLTYLNLT